MSWRSLADGGGGGAFSSPHVVGLARADDSKSGCSAAAGDHGVAALQHGAAAGILGVRRRISLAVKQQMVVVVRAMDGGSYGLLPPGGKGGGLHRLRRSLVIFAATVYVVCVAAGPWAQAHGLVPHLLPNASSTRLSVKTKLQQAMAVF
jgi:hypothetical protein